jgi:signal peptidase I
VNPDPENDRDLAAAASAAEPQVPETAPAPEHHAKTPSLRSRIAREVFSWIWVILIFMFVTGTMVQARVIPSGSMERTLLVGDHLLMSRIGYDVSLPFTQYHLRLWREPHRQQMIIFRSPTEPGLDLIKRLVGMPGDTVEIRSGVVYVNGARLAEPYRNGDPNPADNYDSTVIPPGNFFVLGDNRENSYDSRYWGFVPESNILGTPLVIYMSVDAPDEAWEPGRVRQRVMAYAGVLLHPWRGVRWRRLFTVF